MRTEQALADAVGDWEEAARDALAAARGAARLTVRQLGSTESPDPEGAAERLVGAAERILSELSDHLDEDLDAGTRALALVVGSLSVVDALSIAGDEPPLIVAEERLGNIGQFGQSYAGDVERFAALMREPEVTGGADVPAMTIPDQVTALSDVAGAETVALVTTSVLGGGVQSVIHGLAGVLDAAVRAAAFEDLARQLSGLVNRFKRAATSIVQWIVTHALELVPKSLRNFVEGTVKDRLADLVQRPGHLAGEGLAFLCGAKTLRDRWEAIPTSERPEIDPAAVHAFIRHIAWITTGRRAIERWGGRVVLDLARTAHPVQLAYYIAVATAVVFVVSQEWEGIRALGALL